MDDFRDVLTVQRVIQAKPAAIFALLATPSRHHEFDGSGTVRTVLGPSGTVFLGDTFTMNMHMGMSYRMVNHVVEFDQDRLIAWSTRAPGAAGKLLAGRTWRFQLHPVEQGTHVAQSWDLRTEKFLTRGIVRRARNVTRKNMEKTLERIAAVVE